VTAVFSGTGSSPNATSSTLRILVGKTPAQTAATSGRILQQRSNMIINNQFGGERQVDRLAEFNNPGTVAPGANLSGGNTVDPSRAGPGLDAADLARLRLGNRRGSPTDELGLRNSAFEDDVRTAAPSRGLPVSITGSTDGASNVAFSTSLSQIQRFQAEAEAAKVRGTGGDGALGFARGAQFAGTARPNPFDFWVEGRYTGFRTSQSQSDTDGHFGSLGLGADYVLNRSFLAGVFVSFDSLQQTSKAQASEFYGRGWMAGPYATVKVSDNIFWQARAGWGRAIWIHAPRQLRQRPAHGGNDLVWALGLRCLAVPAGRVDHLSGGAGKCLH
jgi:hypothetical protein